MDEEQTFSFRFDNLFWYISMTRRIFSAIFEKFQFESFTKIKNSNQFFMVPITSNLFFVSFFFWEPKFRGYNHNRLHFQGGETIYGEQGIL